MLKIKSLLFLWELRIGISVSQTQLQPSASLLDFERWWLGRGQCSEPCLFVPAWDSLSPSEMLLAGHDAGPQRVRLE